MKRAVLVGAGTVAGVAAVLALNPDATSTATAAGSSSAASSGTSTGTGSSSSNGSSGSGRSSGSGGTSSNGGSTSTTATTYTGDAVDVGRNYGTVQVEISVSGGRLVDVTALAVPENDPRSSSISQQAMPMLISQAVSAQSASIAGVSGATYTSNGFAESLRSALVKAGLAS
jgi:uncharacterized protein with FMN-binding domain